MPPALAKHSPERALSLLTYPPEGVLRDPMWKRRRLEPPTPDVMRLGFDYQLGQDDLSVRREGGFTRIQLRGGLQTAEPGAPQMPYLLVHVAVPDGTKVAGVHVLGEEEQTLPESHMVMPAQLPPIAALRLKPVELRERYGSVLQRPPLELAEQRQPFVEPHPRFYKLEKPFPLEMARAMGERQVGPYRILTVRVNPVRFVPAKGQLQVAGRFTLAVDLVKGGRARVAKFSKEQLEMHYELLERMVLNPELLRRPDGFKAPGSKAAYLIITSKAMQPEFDRLAEWKTACGTAARVVTREDILAKVYGDFAVSTAGPAADEQEVIRNFVKWAYKAWNVCYLLVGGDVNVIPVREVAALSHYNWFLKEAAAKPAENRCYYSAVTKQVNIHMKDAITAATPLLAMNSGRRIPYNTAASPLSLGWYFATNDTYSAQSATPTRYVVVKGPAATINDARGFYKITTTFSIPTDLYYASLQSTRYNKAGKHDWDALGNGLYGYYSETGEPSGIDFHHDICVGRAPCATADEAKAVVDKLIRYEKYESVSDMATRKAVFAADYWGAPTYVNPAPSGVMAADNQYALAGATTCRIRLKEVPGVHIDVLAEEAGAVYREIPYNRNADATHTGWYFTESATSTAPTGFVIFGIDIKVPTRHIVVRGPSGTLSPQRYWVDNADADGALVEKEAVRALFRAQAPQVDLHHRLYRDFASTPVATAGETVATGVLDTDSLKNALDAGAMFCSLSGHGWHGGCCEVGSTEAVALANGMNQPVVVADSCSTNNFTASDAFSEKMLLNPKGGAIAYLGNTRYSWIGMGDNMERAFWDTLLTPSGTTTLGTAFGARMAALGWNGSTMLWKWIILAQNLLGDPAMRPWAGVPQHLKLKAPLRATPLSVIGVMVQDAAGNPVPFAKVCVYQAGRLMRYVYTDATGRANVSVVGCARGVVQVTATKRSSVPVQQPVRIF